MALRPPIFSHYVDSGVLTLTVYFITPSGLTAHIVINRDLLHTSTMEVMMATQARIIDERARVLNVANERQADP